LFNNTTDIQYEVQSTDTHGTNQVNFAILHLFGYQFAPRYADIYDKVSKSLYGFKHPSEYREGLIKPIRKINHYQLEVGSMVIWLEAGSQAKAPSPTECG
jgi:TnpA family transposase